ncbi:prephenate dehydrogenase [Bdellovibrionota bacterium FG-2]
MKLTVIGLGLIGGSVAIDLRRSGFVGEVVGVDSNEAHRAQALEMKIVDECLPLDRALKGAQLVVLAVPVHAIAAILPGLLDLVPADCTVTDMGSTKEGICKSVATHPKRGQFVPSHPMAGTENSGPGAALRGLFLGKVAVICDVAASDRLHLQRVEKMYEILGMRLLRMDSSEHDLHAAYVSHLSHITSFVLANTVLAKEQNVNTIFDLAGGGFESTVRLAKSSPEMWEPIFEQNRENIIHALESYIEHFQNFHRTLVEHAPAETRQLMADANRIRRVLNQINTPTQIKPEDPSNESASKTN